MVSRSLILLVALTITPMASSYLLPIFNLPKAPGSALNASSRPSTGAKARLQHSNPPRTTVNMPWMKWQKTSSRDNHMETANALRNQRPGIVRTSKIWAPYIAIVAGGAALLGASAGGLATAAGFSIATLHTLLTVSFTVWSSLCYGLFSGDGQRVVRLLGGAPATKSSRADQAMSKTTKALLAADTELGDKDIRRMAEHPPTAFIIPTDEPNAFAAGRGKRTVVAVTEGLMRRLDDNELNAVIAHELGHVMHADVGHHMQQAAMAGGFSGALEMGVRVFSHLGSSDDKASDAVAAGSLAVVCVGAAQYALGTALRLFASRHDEFMADAFAARIPGGAEALARALRKIEVTHTST